MGNAEGMFPVSGARPSLSGGLAGRWKGGGWAEKAQLFAVGWGLSYVLFSPHWREAPNGQDDPNVLCGPHTAQHHAR